MNSQEREDLLNELAREWARIKREPSDLGTTGPRLTPKLIDLLDANEERRTNATG